MGIGPWTPQLVAVLGLLLHVYVAQAGLEHTCTLATRQRGAHPGGICGRRLPNIMRHVCQTVGRGYAGGHREFGKRGAVTGSDDTAAEEGRLLGFLMSKRQALSYFQKEKSPLAVAGYNRRLQKRHGSQGITCECCYNRCSFNELLQYCN